MLTLFLAAILSADSPARFTDGGLRSASGQTIPELSRLTINAPLPEVRAQSAERLFQAFARYSGPLNVQYPRCHVGRTFDQLQQRDYLQPPPQRFNYDEMQQFKAACYLLINKSPDHSRLAMEHLVAVVSHEDLQPMIGLLRTRKHAGLACIALGRIGKDEAVPALSHELAGECKEQAAAALEYMASPKAMAALKRVAALPPAR